MTQPGKPPHNNDGDVFFGGLLIAGIWIGIPVCWIRGLVWAAMTDSWGLFAIFFTLPPIGIICGIGTFLGLW